MQTDQVRGQDIGEGMNRLAPQEYYYHAGLDRPAATTTGLSEADGVLVLKELLEEEDEDEAEKYSTSSPPHVDDDDADRLSRVMRSLEAEIMRGGDNGECLARPPGPGEINGCVQLDQMLLDFDDGFGGAAGFGYYWPEVPAGGIYVYSEAGEGSVVGYEMQVAREQQYYCADQCSGEQVYSSSLWE